MNAYLDNAGKDKSWLYSPSGDPFPPDQRQPLRSFAPEKRWPHTRESE